MAHTVLSNERDDARLAILEQLDLRVIDDATADRILLVLGLMPRTRVRVVRLTTTIDVEVPGEGDDQSALAFALATHDGVWVRIPPGTTPLPSGAVVLSWVPLPS